MHIYYLTLKITLQNIYPVVNLSFSRMIRQKVKQELEYMFSLNVLIFKKTACSGSD